jgi:hypothetical protein
MEANLTINNYQSYKTAEAFKMDTWTLINGLVYLIDFVLIGWVLLDAVKVSKRA